MKPLVDFDEFKQFSADLLKIQDVAYPKSIAAQSLRSAARPLLYAEQIFAPRNTGRMKADIRSKSVSNDKYYATVIVGVSKKLGARGRVTHLVTRGTKARYNRSGAFRGRVLANDFLDKAFATTKDEVLKDFGEDYQKRIAAWIKNRRYRAKTIKKPEI